MFTKIQNRLRIRARLSWLYERRYYFVHKLVGNKIPQHNLSYLPDGFRIHKVANTGVSVVDGFCTPEEARAVIALASGQLKPSAVQIDGKFVLAKAEVDKNNSQASKFGVMSIPAVKLFKDGKVVDEFVGAMPESQVKEFLDKNL